MATAAASKESTETETAKMEKSESTSFRGGDSASSEWSGDEGWPSDMEEDNPALHTTLCLASTATFLEETGEESEESGPYSFPRRYTFRFRIEADGRMDPTSVAETARPPALRHSLYLHLNRPQDIRLVRKDPSNP